LVQGVTLPALADQRTECPSLVHLHPGRPVPRGAHLHQQPHTVTWPIAKDVDAEVVEWLKDNRDATAKQFEDFLRQIYNRPDMRARFPNGF
jgi:hypothetical protein